MGNSNKETVIVSRHSGLVEWLKRNGVNGEVVSHATPENIRGKYVIGNLPIHLASLAYRIIVPVYDIPESLRGQELTADDLDKLGCQLKSFFVLESLSFPGSEWD